MKIPSSFEIIKIFLIALAISSSFSSCRQQNSTTEKVEDKEAQLKKNKEMARYLMEDIIGKLTQPPQKLCP